ncbi:hypothetical protein GJ496_006207 [Pomphorhynchus laevis]|nr:hypothetical protein GJ496_006207 [Pomphorhynchus laevis]
MIVPTGIGNQPSSLYGKLIPSNSTFTGESRVPSKRLSSLAGPTMLLTGHEAEVLCARFNPCGNLLATASFDRKILLWDAYGNCSSYGALIGHGGAILEVCWNSSGSELVSCATDRLVCVWDVETLTRIKKLKGHKSFVNSTNYFENNLICSGSDDGTVKIWDRRRKPELATLDSNYPILTCCFSGTKDQIFSAGIDNDIKIWDIRTLKEESRLVGHSDSPTGLALSPSTHHLASNSMDGTVRVWDLRPYSSGDRCIAVLAGHQHSFEKNLLRVHWSHDESRITAGSSDRYVHVWLVSNKQLLYKLPGHTGSVNEADFHPNEPILVSASSDKTVYIGEIE